MNLIFIICIAVILLISFIAKANKKKPENKKVVKEFHKERKNDYNKPPKEDKKPSDYNDKQVLTKYNVGTYRNEKGQYASLNK